MIFSVLVINKAGGLVYQKTLNEGHSKLTVNDYLVFASSFQSIHAISTGLSKKGNSGIHYLSTKYFNLHCFQSLTGIKFILISDPQVTDAKEMLSLVYTHYSDYAMKNPFHTMEMPIKSDLFDKHVALACKQ